MRQPTESEEPSKPETILVVDDDPLVCRATSHLVTVIGYCVRIADNGDEAIEIVKNTPTEIDAVLMDVSMPVMNGIECFEALMKISPTLPVILISGHPFVASELQRLNDLGLRGYLKKPYRIADLEPMFVEVFGK
ncbi:response regulator [Rubripirellula reticaptiva]|uniref:Response regulator MprA n=1 Tax=Rubripirellula reticaptiva TaxID=2528013 RepID=A0A5C6EV54_9BACT|nr:response regulator [Rubripirellula reticaptiva]TWU51947.1 Response regulator MprA [Rubripirellula reticaptiva]